MRTPSIKIKYSLNEETKIFLTFLHHPQFPRHKDMIFRAFPELKIALDKKSEFNEKVSSI